MSVLSALPYLAFALCLLVTAVLAGVLAAHFKLKREVAAQAKRNRRVEAMLLRIREATPSMDGSAPSGTPQSESGDLEPPAWAGPAPAIPRPGMNLSRRVQALRLLRRGEDLGHIAAALGVPLREVELLVRVHQLSMAASAAASATATPRPKP